MKPTVSAPRLIPLTQGQFAIVDVSDYGWLSRWKWYAYWNPFTRSFYARRTVTCKGQRKTVLMHRQILGLGKGRLGDHRDHNTLNNQRHNLRSATRCQNAHNARKRRDNTSGFKGASYDKRNGKWAANIAIRGKLRWLGYHPTAESAHAAYCKAAIKIYGDFARFE